MDMNIGLSAWIIMDSNYPEFETGKEYQFALKFHALEFEECREHWPSLTLIDAWYYSFVGQILVAQQSITVLDAGLKCYSWGQRHDRPPKPGDWVAGRLRLGVDPFYWYDGYGRRPDAPALSYRWRVEKILLDTTPLVESTDGTKRRVDPGPGARRHYTAIQKTDAFEDDGGHADYLLQCKLLGSAF
jgi:hypothetical protein